MSIQIWVILLGLCFFDFSSNENCLLVKFADDTALLGLITKYDDVAYLEQINYFINYCGQTFLELNVNKTKEMVIDFRKPKGVSNEVIIPFNPIVPNWLKVAFQLDTMEYLCHTKVQVPLSLCPFWW